MYGRAWTHAEGPVALFNHAVPWLRKNRVLLPGVSVLARQVSEARTAAERRLYERWPGRWSGRMRRARADLGGPAGGAGGQAGLGAGAAADSAVTHRNGIL
ncbi:DUF4158 domain-containing protein [Streptomyces sp. AJS327]|uniref:DUF4158 domain-containing protein n=1 Tax=Streptomyces sp. AJS327 TaxID=2545265 RepID=UPI0015E00382|nr:DUF4158 domain-containing protein [Streptomyces sp. AJS327]